MTRARPPEQQGAPGVKMRLAGLGQAIVYVVKLLYLRRSCNSSNSALRGNPTAGLQIFELTEFIDGRRQAFA